MDNKRTDQVALAEEAGDRGFAVYTTEEHPELTEDRGSAAGKKEERPELTVDRRES